jgi:hypothetical protein
LITPQNTFDIFIGSGALNYPWFDELSFTGFVDGEAQDDWSVTFSLPAEFGENEGKRYTVSHKLIMQTVHKIVRGQQKGVNPNGDIRRECRTMLRNVDDCDFDAGMADCVLQAVALNDVVYG